MTDLFTRPAPLRPDLVLDVEPQLDSVIDMLACHRTQVFEWLAYEQGILDQVPQKPEQRLAWLRTWFQNEIAERANRFREALIATYGEEKGRAITCCEAFEVSEYAAQLDDDIRTKLWPF